MTSCPITGKPVVHKTEMEKLMYAGGKAVKETSFVLGENPTKPAPVDEPPPQPALVASSHCDSCGNVFLDDSVFCHKCGAKRMMVPP